MNSDSLPPDLNDVRTLDRAAVATLYHEHQPWLLGLLRRRLGSQHPDVWDLVQDTFERVLRQPRWTAQEQPRGYLGAIAKRLLIDRHRHRQIETAYLEALAHQPEPSVPSPEALLAVVQQLTRVCATLDAMPTRMRRVFLLARLEGLPYADVARQLDLSLNVVQKDMVQAWQRFYHVLHD